jgi:peptidoglycan lytic transglycosylase
MEKAVGPTTRAIFALLVVFCVFALPTSAQHSKRRARRHSAQTPSALPVPSAEATASKDNASSEGPGLEAKEQELARLSRALRGPASENAYAALSAFAVRNSREEIGARAALALGYFELVKQRPELALAWLRRAVNEKLLREYVQYWHAETSLALGEKAAALEQLESFRRDFPDSVMTDQAVTLLAQTALATGKPEDAAAALDAYPNTSVKSTLLLLRAQAREKAAQAKGEKPLTAAADYLDVFYRFPLDDEAKTAGQKLPSLQLELGESFPGTPMQTQIARAEAIYLAKRWRDARAEYDTLLPKLSGVDRERAVLRVAQCDVQMGGRTELLEEVPLTDPDLNAERLFTIVQIYRTQKLEPQLVDEVEQIAKSAPQSPWVEDAWYAAGTYYWANVDRDRAAEYYRRVLEAFPDGKDAPVAAWRVAWTAYLERKSEAADLLEAYIRRFPNSNYIPDALYFLGRWYERSDNLPLARSFYVTGSTRFPLTYFGARAAERLRPEPEGIDSAPLDPSDVVSAIPPAPPLPAVDRPLPVAVLEREARARALTSIAFDGSAELEYRAAYATSHAPRMLLEAAAAAVAAGHYSAGFVALRQVYPQLEARRVPDIPIEAWRVAYPLPYEAAMRSAAARSQVDPMLVAGLIRQESAFEPKAVSHAGAMGLMQVLPKTALKLARQLRVRYSHAQLAEPGYNLQLGSRYLAELIRTYGTTEAALAAYNAGEDRVGQWTTGQSYLETPEFVESIPFSETREYVQIVMRNAEVYRQVYNQAGMDQNRPPQLEDKTPEKAASARRRTAQRRPRQPVENP